jgi:hypothetical protein
MFSELGYWVRNGPGILSFDLVCDDSVLLVLANEYGMFKFFYMEGLNLNHKT